MEGKLGMSQQYALTPPESQLYPRLHQKKHGRQVKGGDAAPMLYSGETSSGVMCPDVEFSVQE